MDNLEIIVNDHEYLTVEMKEKLEKYQVLVSEFDPKEFNPESKDDDREAKDTYELIVLTNSLRALRNYMETTAKQRYPHHEFQWKKKFETEYLTSNNNSEIELYYDKFPGKEEANIIAVTK